MTPTRPASCPDGAEPLSAGDGLASLTRALGPDTGRTIVGPVLLAVSGGPDSIAMLHLAAINRRDLGRLGLFLHVATVDHGLREAGASEARAVARTCEGLGLPHRILTWTGPKPSSNRQCTARSARYRLLADAAATIGACAILTAHHQDDQIETHGLARARHAGDRGLAGMRVRRALAPGLDLVRPFLDVPGRRLRGTAQASGLPVFDDPSNDDERYDRVRLRRRLASLGADDRAGLIDAIARHRAAADAVDRRIADALGGADGAAVDGSGTVRLPDRRWRDLDGPVRAELFGRILVAVGGAEHAPPRAALERLAERMARPGATAATLGGVRVEPGPVVVFARDYGRTGPAPVAFDPAGPGQLFDGRFLVSLDDATVSPGALRGALRLVPFGALGRGFRADRTLPVLVGETGAPVAVPDRLSDKLPETSGRLFMASRVDWRMWADLPRDDGA